MVGRPRSPIKVQCIYDRGERLFCRFRCVAPVRAAEFRSRHDPKEYAILHPSTKPGHRGKWQMSRFDDGGPWGDTIYATCDLAVRDHLPSSWRLAKVVAGATALKGVRRRRS
jgi:hypothetical protein